MQVADAGPLYALAVHNGELIASGGTNVGSLGDTGSYVARYVAELPATNNDARRSTDTALLLITLAALTALAGVQIRRYV